MDVQLSFVAFFEILSQFLFVKTLYVLCILCHKNVSYDNVISISLFCTQLVFLGIALHIAGPHCIVKVSLCFQKIPQLYNQVY